MTAISHRIISLTLLLLFIPVAKADKDALEAELKHFIDRYKTSSFLTKRIIIEEIYWKGFSDSKFWDLVAIDVKKSLAELEHYEQKGRLASQRDNLMYYADKAAYTIKWLSVSGNEKYRSFIRNIPYKNANHSESAKYKRKIARFRKLALDSLGSKAAQNKIITKGLENANGNEHDRVRARNMLSSQDFRLIKVGTKFIIERYADDQELVDIAHDVFISHYRTNKEKEVVRALTNICKALAANGDPIYKRTLEDAANNAKHAHVKKAAAKYLTLF